MISLRGVRPSLTLRAWLVIVAVSAALIFLTGDESHFFGLAKNLPTQLPYAYLTDGDYGELVVMNNGKEVARTPRVSDGGNPDENQVVWTFDGYHVAVLAKLLYQGVGGLQDLSRQAIISVNTHNKIVTRIPCPYCYGIAASGDHEITALENRSGAESLVTFNLNSRRPTPSGTFPIATSRYSHRLIQGLPGLVLLDATDAASFPPEDLFIMAKGALGPDYGYQSAELTVPAASALRTAYSGPLVAVRTSLGNCGSVLLLDGKTNGYLPVNASNGIGDVDDLWWDQQGYLHATSSPGGCAGLSDDQASTSSLWRLNPSMKWVLEDKGPLSMVRQLNKTTQIMLLKPTDPYSGTLYTETSGQRTQVATKVLLISMA